MTDIPQPSLSQRLRQARRLLADDGIAQLSLRLRRRAAQLIDPPGSARIDITRQDLIRATEVARSGWTLPGSIAAWPEEPLSISWVCAPPSEGSGGHTTIFRMVAALERAGHTCTVYLIDPHRWSIEQHQRTIRTLWPSVTAQVRDVSHGIADCHALFATDWRSAYVTLASPAKGARFYFVQDFEPMFYAAGSEYLLAEATYRFGYHGVTAGGWLAAKLRDDYGMTTDSFDFGCDPATYYLEERAGEPTARVGVCYYCRPSTPRRAHELAVMSLDLFAEEHPDIDIHVFGEPAGRLPFRAVRHGLLTPQALNSLYNRCIAGLVLSATNVSLVPLEMLAAGCVPVINDAQHNRTVLGDAAVSYASSTPFALAEALSTLVRPPADERAAMARRVAVSVRGRSWENAGESVEKAIVRSVIQYDSAKPAAPRSRNGAHSRNSGR